MKQASLFDKIDSYYEKQPNSNVFYMTIFLFLMLFGYLIYDYTYESSEEYVATETQKLDNAKAELQKLDDFIERERQNSQIQRLTQEIMSVDKRKKEVDAENLYFDEKLRDASRLLYNQKNWSEFMAKIDDISRKYNVVLGDVNSSVNDLVSQKVEEVFNVNFSIVGKFQNILQFVNSLEQSIDVVDVNMLKLDKININNESNEQTNNSEVKYTSDIKADIKISIWGIKY
ncbi:hypothetical protein AVANS14531_06850 [Campylobacter sp. Cr9]|uniref:hypothetical protein n=1 Tax=unclassified Campylobacter TaxID=2593542 RepID=UPI001EFA87CE|nr:hypothetical protein [Campylobacter sp. RM5004]MBZ7986049.1 hypothetical protein [Campylobacter sp. Cr9]ULO01842.1 hypothetical protein AVANS_1223 [Campylobacter sp. RM5004]